jgi:hypothetical protein
MPDTPVPLNDPFVGGGKLITSSAWRKFFMGLTNTPVLKSRDLTANLTLGALEFYDDGTTGHLYVTLNVAGVLTRRQIV